MTFFVDLGQFPAEHNFDSAFMAHVKSNLIGVRELEDLLVGGPVLYACIVSCCTNELVLS